jgi:DNA gyrase subunit A
MIINKSGITIRLKVEDVRIMGRATQGVRLINLEKRNDQIGSVCKVESESDEENLTEVIEGEDILTIEPMEDNNNEENNN